MTERSSAESPAHPPGPLSRIAKFSRVVLMLAMGTLGGFSFQWLGLPLPWMMGAMLFSIIAALSPLPIASPRPIRPPLAAVIGVTLGSTFTYDIVSGVGRWGVVFLAMLVFTVASMIVNVFYFRRIAGYDTVTAYFASIPGGIYDMTMLGEEAGGDGRKIALTHSTRIFILVLLVPFIFRFYYGLGGSGTVAPTSQWSAFPIIDVAWLVGAGAVGWAVGHLIRLPTAPLLGPLLLSAVIHVFGLTHAAPPGPLVAAAQVVLGTTIGSQFIGAPLALLLRAMGHSLVLFVPVIALCALIAWPTALIANVDFPVIILALAPGGMSEMSLIALAMHAEVAIVSANQMLRMLSAQLFGPAAFHLWARIRRGKTDA